MTCEHALKKRLTTTLFSRQPIIDLDHASMQTLCSDMTQVIAGSRDNPAYHLAVEQAAIGLEQLVGTASLEIGQVHMEADSTTQVALQVISAQPDFMENLCLVSEIAKTCRDYLESHS